MKKLVLCIFALMLISASLVSASDCRKDGSCPSFTSYYKWCQNNGGCNGNNGNGNSPSAESSGSENGFPLITCLDSKGEKRDIMMPKYVAHKSQNFPKGIITLTLGDYKLEGYEWRARVIDGDKVRLAPERYCNKLKLRDAEGVLPVRWWIS